MHLLLRESLTPQTIDCRLIIQSRIELHHRRKKSARTYTPQDRHSDLLIANHHPSYPHIIIAASANKQQQWSASRDGAKAARLAGHAVFVVVCDILPLNSAKLNSTLWHKSCNALFTLSKHID